MRQRKGRGKEWRRRSGDQLKHMPLSALTLRGRCPELICILLAGHFYLHLWTIAFPQCPLQPRPLSPLSGLGHVSRAQPETTPGWKSEQELQSTVEGGGRGGSFSAGRWRRAVSEHVSLHYRTVRKSLGSEKEALQDAPTASALHLLHPLSSPHWFLPQVQLARLLLPACLVPPAQDFRLLGLLGVVVCVFSGGFGSGWERGT